MPFDDSADALRRFRGCFLTIPQMPFDDSAEPLEESADILRGFRRRAADYLRGRSAEFVKLLVTCTIYPVFFVTFALYVRPISSCPF